MAAGKSLVCKSAPRVESPMTTNILNNRATPPKDREFIIKYTDKLPSPDQTFREQVMGNPGIFPLVSGSEPVHPRHFHDNFPAKLENFALRSETTMALSTGRSRWNDGDAIAVLFPMVPVTWTAGPRLASRNAPWAPGKLRPNQPIFKRCRSCAGNNTFTRQRVQAYPKDRAKQPHLPWHCLYFLPLPQGHGSLRPTFGVSRRIVTVGRTISSSGSAEDVAEVPPEVTVVVT